MSEAEVNEKINLIYLNSIADMVEYKFPETAKYFKEFVVPKILERVHEAILYNILKRDFDDLAKEHNQKMESCRTLQNKHKKLIADIKVWMDRLQSDAHLINYTHEMLYSTLHTLLFAIGEQ